VFRSVNSVVSCWNNSPSYDYEKKIQTGIRLNLEIGKVLSLKRHIGWGLTIDNNNGGNECRYLGIYGSIIVYRNVTSIIVLRKNNKGKEWAGKIPQWTMKSGIKRKKNQP
jgi:hypothetical protein